MTEKPFLMTWHRDEAVRLDLEAIKRHSRVLGEVNPALQAAFDALPLQQQAARAEGRDLSWDAERDDTPESGA